MGNTPIMTESTFVNPEFYALKLAANDAYNRQPVGKAHCDCRLANEAYFGGVITNHRFDPEWSYTMVPVKAVEGACPHCGYIVALLPPQDYTQANHMRKMSAKARQKTEADKASGKWAVVGTNLSTGEKKVFESAKAAYEAGFGAVLSSMKKGTPLHGWLWTKASA